VEPPPAEELRHRLRQRSRRDWDVVAATIALLTAWSLYFMFTHSRMWGFMLGVWLAGCAASAVIAWRTRIRPRASIARSGDDEMFALYRAHLDVELKKAREMHRQQMAMRIVWIVLVAALGGMFVWQCVATAGDPSGTVAMALMFSLSQAIQRWRIRTELPELERESAELRATARAR
jgi:hypothetical protein